jgi:hypothetical protein
VALADSGNLSCKPIKPESKALSQDAEKFVTQTLSTLKSLNCNCSQNIAPHPSSPPFPRVNDFKLDHNVCENSDVAQLCAVATTTTWNATENVVAWGAHICPKGFGLPEEDLIHTEIEKFKYTTKKFNSITQDPKMQIRCCGNNLTCQSEWAATKLKILMGLGSNSQLAQSDIRKPYDVEISVGSIANCLSEDCIDYTLLHELGHVCHRRQREDSVPVFSATLHDLEFYLEKGGAKCVRDSLVREHDKLSLLRKVFTDLDYWAEEAYADAVFVDYWGPAALGWECWAKENSEHCEPDAFLGCFFKVPGFRNRYCK